MAQCMMSRPARLRERPLQEGSMDTLQVLGDLGDFVSAIAVVVTLALLVVQVRDSKRVIQENSALIRAAAFDTGLDQLSRWRGRLIESAEVASLWIRGGAGEPLSADDATRYDALANDLLNTRISSYRRWSPQATRRWRRCRWTSWQRCADDTRDFSAGWPRRMRRVACRAGSSRRSSRLGWRHR
jgi:hypothetical protein